MDAKNQIAPDQIRKIWDVLTNEGDVREVAVFQNGPKRIGYFDNPDDLVNELAALNFTWDAVYWTVNATGNKVCTNAFNESHARASDSDVARLTILFIDIDVKSKGSESATDAERTAAYDRLLQVVGDAPALKVLGKSRLKEVYFALLRTEAGPIVLHRFGERNEIANTICFLRDNLRECTQLTN